MKRKLGKKNIRLFVLFSFLVLLVVCLFGYFIYQALVYDKETYKECLELAIENKDSLTFNFDSVKKELKELKESLNV